jgi:hypothetical protein
MYLHMIPNITSSAPPPMDINLESLWDKYDIFLTVGQQPNWVITKYTHFCILRSVKPKNNESIYYI